MAAAEAGLYRSSRFCCGSRHFARQRWIIEPLQGKAQPHTLTQTGTLPGAFVGCKVCKSLGQAANFPELFWSSLSLSKGNFRQEQTPACSAQSPVPWKQVCEQLCCCKAQPDLAINSSANEVADGWTTAPEEPLSVPLSVGMPDSCEEGKAAEMLCWTTYMHSAKMFQQLLLWAKGECLVLYQKINISRRSVLRSEVTLNMRLPIPQAYGSDSCGEWMLMSNVDGDLNPFRGNSVTILSYLLENQRHASFASHRHRTNPCPLPSRKIL